MKLKLPCWLFGHDWDMQFPEETSLHWIFVCTKCGKKKDTMI